MDEAQPQVSGPAVASGRVDARHWRALLMWLSAASRTPDLATGAKFVAQVSAAADRIGCRPDVTLRPDQVHVRTTTLGRAASPSRTLPWPRW